MNGSFPSETGSLLLCLERNTTARSVSRPNRRPRALDTCLAMRCLPTELARAAAAEADSEAVRLRSARAASMLEAAIAQSTD
ncbi:MAG: hypothetical protein ACHBNF_04985 [Chromatiales bacterium]